jgi:hypothetical protein
MKNRIWQWQRGLIVAAIVGVFSVVFCVLPSFANEWDGSRVLTTVPVLMLLMALVH